MFVMFNRPAAGAASLALAFLWAGKLYPQTQKPAPRAVLNQYCVTCHNSKLKTAGLVLDQLDLSHVAEHAQQWEKVARKLRTAEMRSEERRVGKESVSGMAR